MKTVKIVIFLFSMLIYSEVSLSDNDNLRNNIIENLQMRLKQSEAENNNLKNELSNVGIHLKDALREQKEQLVPFIKSEMEKAANMSNKAGKIQEIKINASISQNNLYWYSGLSLTSFLLSGFAFMYSSKTSTVPLKVTWSGIGAGIGFGSAAYNELHRYNIAKNALNVATEELQNDISAAIQARVRNDNQN